nr:patatin-like phospholipase family protein [Hyphomicrobium methylovorum]
MVATLCLAGCAATIPRNGISDASLAATAEIPDMSGVRFWADEVPKDPIAEIRRRTSHLPPIARDARSVGGRKIIETLALSGGGSDGAFGAGVLAGWTKRGDRPEFEVVTGVSAGAIIAPFAFLGPSEDQKLHTIWTQYKQNEVITTQFLPALFGGPALADTAPLEALIAQYVDRPFVDRIAREYKRGRILMVLTTNLDAQRPVVWNMGEIALDRSDRAIELFRKVILASAAIPAAFPPVKIEVVAGGKIYDELHVDGGTTNEVFILPVHAPLKAFDALYPEPPIRRFYVIKNGKASPEQSVVQPTTLQIASRSISTLIKSQNQSELYRIYRITRDGGADFNFMSVPASFNYTTKEIYDPQYQAALYAEGVAEGRKGIWLKSPPGQTPINAAAPQKKMAPAVKPMPMPKPDTPQAKQLPAKSKKVATIAEDHSAID